MKIDQFHLEEERKEQGEPMIQVLDLEDKLERSSGVRTSGIIVARIDNSSEEEKEEMSLNRKRDLRELLANKAKGSVTKDASGSQPPLPLPPPPLPLVNPFAPANLKNMKKENKVAEEGELVPQKEGVPPSSKRKLRVRGGPLLSRARRPSLWLRCAPRTRHGTLG